MSDDDFKKHITQIEDDIAGIKSFLSQYDKYWQDYVRKMSRFMIFTVVALIVILVVLFG